MLNAGTLMVSQVVAGGYIRRLFTIGGGRRTLFEKNLTDNIQYPRCLAKITESTDFICEPGKSELSYIYDAAGVTFLVACLGNDLVSCHTPGPDIGFITLGCSNVMVKVNVLCLHLNTMVFISIKTGV